MARHYSTKSFFRQAPNALLARYFNGQGVLADFDFSTLKEGNPQPLFDAWLTLPAEQRDRMDAEFQEIFALSCEKGTKALIDEARWHLGDETPQFTEWLAKQRNYHEKSFHSFLEYPNFWKGATRFFHADSLSYWRKRKNLPKVPAQCDDASLRQLARLIRDYFHHTEGRGRNCEVDPLRRNDLDYFFAYPEDYSQRSIEWVDGEFKPRPHNPAFEIIFVFSQRDGTLDLHYSGDRKAVEPLQTFFAEAILKEMELKPDEDDNRVYDLDLLRGRDFPFIYDAGSGIESVAVKKLRLSSKVKKGDRITLEADSKIDSYAVYDLLDRVAKSLPMHHYNVTQVELVATVIVSPDSPPKNIPIRITHPNSCSLKYDKLDLKLREMLERSGIEPKEPEASAET
jgi:hypothetical protein